jgi:outer membrane biosynthesis protein TonB
MSDPVFFEHFRELARQQRSPVAPPSTGGSVKRQEGFFRRALTVSLGLHGSLLLITVVGPMVAAMLGVSMDYSDKFQKKEFKNAIRVDMVGLPALTLQELQNVDPTQDVGKGSPTAPEPTPVEEAAAPPPPSETAMKLEAEKKAETAKAEKAKAEADAKKKAASEAQAKRLADLRASMRVEQRRKELANELKGEGGEGEGRAPLAGNILSQGYSVTGDVADDMDVFQGHLKAHLRKTWSLPGWMLASNLSSRVLVKLAPTGMILSQSFLKKSGNEEFDRYVVQALKDAEPYPAPPPSLQRIIMEQGIEWGFPQ